MSTLWMARQCHDHRLQPCHSSVEENQLLLGSQTMGPMCVNACVCLWISKCLLHPCQISHDCDHCVCQTRGDLFPCLSLGMYVCVCPVLQAGKVPVFVCHTVRGDTLFVVFNNLSCCGSSPSGEESLVFFVSFIRHL